MDIRVLTITWNLSLFSRETIKIKVCKLWFSIQHNFSYNVLAERGLSCMYLERDIDLPITCLRTSSPSATTGKPGPRGDGLPAWVHGCAHGVCG